MRRTAQKREIGGDLQFRVTRHPFRKRRHGQTSAASGRHHSSAIRSGPSARVTRCRRRRQVKRNGGSSGKSQNASTGSGGSNSRIGRGGLPPPLTHPALWAGSPLSRTAGEGGERSEAGEGEPTATLTEARSGMWLSRGSSRDTAASPSRLPS